MAQNKGVHDYSNILQKVQQQKVIQKVSGTLKTKYIQLMIEVYRQEKPYCHDIDPPVAHLHESY